MLRHTFNGLTLAIVMHFGKAPPNLILHVVLAYVCLNVLIMICARLFAVAQTLRHADLMFECSPEAAARAAYKEQLSSQEAKKDWVGAANTVRTLYLLDHQESK
jgi:uncharacterized membrane protein YccC